jgi:hypothetical protein
VANSVLAKMAVVISANTAQLNAGLTQARKQFESFSKVLVAGFAVKEVASFVTEISKLAGEAEGVRVAFEKLPNSIALMTRLKEATAGTVSELELMRKSVQASNFGISLEALPQLLEFAAVRAKQTGVSVDYLVDSIVTGIGRKSKLILDNLGISAVQLTEALGGASTAASSIGDVADAVGKIASKELERMGTISENAATKVERLAAEWENLKVRIGEAANSTGIFGGIVDGLTSFIKGMSDVDENMRQFIGTLGQSGKQVDILTKNLTEFAAQGKIAFTDVYIDKLIQQYELGTIKADKLRKVLKQIQLDSNKVRANAETVDVDPLTGLPLDGGEFYQKQAKEIENIATLTEKLNLLQTDQLTLTGKQLMITNQEIKAIEEKIKKLRELGVEQAKTNDSSAAKARASSVVLGSSVAGFDTSKINFAGGKNGIAGIQGAIANATQVANDKQKEQIEIIMRSREAWANFGSSVSDSIAQVISANESFGKSLAKIAARIIDQLEQITLARMVADSAKFGVGGILAAAAGFGIVKGIFGKISKASEFSSSQGFNPVARQVTFRQRGTDLVGVISETDRLNSRTRG